MPTTSCLITGMAEVTELSGFDGRRNLVWTRADPAVHIAGELLETADEQGLKFLTDKYEIGECCPHNPNSRHARLRDQP